MGQGRGLAALMSFCGSLGSGGRGRGWPGAPRPAPRLWVSSGSQQSELQGRARGGTSVL